MMQSRALHYFAQLHTFVDSAIDQGIFGGAVFFVKREGDWILHGAKGSLSADSDEAPMDEDIIFDVASLTKVLVTTPAIMLLQEAGELSIDDPVADYIESFRDTEKLCITIKDLLTHSSGLPAWAPLYVFADDKDEAIEFISHIPLRYTPGKEIEYSCLGFILLGRIVELVSGQDIAEFARGHIFEPLGLRQTFFRPPRELLSRIAPTEHGNVYEQAKAAQFIEEFSTVASQDRWLASRLRRAKRRLDSMRREGLIRGQVHDSNAYFLGGVSGNAGVFSCASDVMKMAEQFLPGASGRKRNAILSPESVRQMITPQKEVGNQCRGLGWQLIKGNGTSGGRLISRRAFGHTGFTGCSLWIDPLRELAVVLLSNAVCPRYKPDGMAAFRPAFHDLVVQFSDCIFSPAHA